jgi:hypothetical protein
VRLIALAHLDGGIKPVDSPEARRELRAMVSVYRPGLPQVCRIPGVMWFYAVMMAGDFTRLSEVIEAAVATSRELGDEWELAFNLQLRARMVNSRSGGPCGVDRDVDESLEIFSRLGDAWGAAEVLSGRGELREQRGEFALAAEDYEAAIGLAERLGSLVQVALLRSRLAGVLIETGDAEAAARGEQGLREVIAGGPQTGAEPLSYARLYLAVRCGNTGRTGEARAQLEELHAEFGNRALGLFQGLVLGLLAWLDVLDGRPADALVKIREGLAMMADPITLVVAPHMPVVQFLTGACALAWLGGEGDATTAARLVGAYDALRPRCSYTPSMEREVRADTETRARAVLGDAAYERARAEGGGLSLPEATALV